MKEALTEIENIMKKYKGIMKIKIEVMNYVIF